MRIAAPDCSNYTHLVARLLWLLLCPAIVAACPRSSATSQADCEIVYAGGVLSVVSESGVLWHEPVPDARPYRVVALGPPALATTCGPDLMPTTWAVSDTATAYPGMLPALCLPPLVAISPLPNLDDPYAPGVMLLGPTGSVLWRAEAAELLLPQTGEADRSTAFVVSGQGDAVFTFGTEPRLTAVEASSGHVLWQTALAPRSPVAGVVLWGAEGAHGLLSLQYDYELFEFVRFDLRRGSLGERWQLVGQPAFSLVYPGPSDEPSRTSFAGSKLSVLVFPQTGPRETWAFDLASGELARSPDQGAPPASRREDNPLPEEGSATPGPPAPPFPQRLLPTESGTAWRIPALITADGRALVVEGETARLVKLAAP